jgi:hypothetical protein
MQHLVEKRYEGGVSLTKCLRGGELETRARAAVCVCMHVGKSAPYLLEFYRVMRSKHLVPRVRLKRKAHCAITRHGRQLEEVATCDHLYASERLGRVPHDPCELLGEGKGGGVEHADLVDDEGAHLLAPFNSD